MEGYLIIICGYEGIEKIVGLFEKEVATERMRHFRRHPGRHIKGTQYCVLKASASGAECACKDLGVATKKRWLY